MVIIYIYDSRKTDGSIIIVLDYSFYWGHCAIVYDCNNGVITLLFFHPLFVGGGWGVVVGGGPSMAPWIGIVHSATGGTMGPSAFSMMVRDHWGNHSLCDSH